jgi:hypothetical protein
MLNQLILVGRVVNTEDLTLRVNEQDIPILINEPLKENLKQFDMENKNIAIKGRLEIIEGNLTVVTEKVTFLSPREVKESDES